MVQRKQLRGGRQSEAVRPAEPITSLSDDQLLCRFEGDARESAFRELVHRHGPMVMGVCRQVLRHPHDAEDAFQATFLVLLIKARSIHVAESLGPWLHSVAYRTAQRARTSALRYRHDVRDALETITTESQDADHFEIRRLLQEELARLPNKYREPIVLCHFEGKTHEEAARLLHWPVGTVSGRLSRGRELLKGRLERRGVAVPSAVIMTSWLELTQSVHLSSIESALAVVMGFTTAQSVSASVISLTRGVIKTMFLNRLKTISFAVLGMGIVSGIVWAHMPSSSVRQPSQAGELTLAATPDASALSAPKSNQVQPPADSSYCPLAQTGDADFECPMVMAANAVTRMMGYFHDSGSTSSR